MNSSKYTPLLGFDGALLVLSPLPLLFPSHTASVLPEDYQLIIAIIASVACLSCSFVITKNALAGKALGVTAVAGGYLSIAPHAIDNPFVALTSNVLCMSILFFLFDFRKETTDCHNASLMFRRRQKAWWGYLALIVLITINFLLRKYASSLSPFIIFIALIEVIILFLNWLVRLEWKTKIIFLVSFSSVFLLIYVFEGIKNIQNITLLFCMAVLITFTCDKERLYKREHWWESLLTHPARILLTTFFSLCLFGTLLLILPMATHNDSISLIDAAFTSVSAVCVTGLIVLDTPNDFSLFGQICILLLIQLGGLGIMSITIVALHAIGRRLSLKQERLLTTMTDTDHKNLLQSLKTILTFTFIIEGFGALILFFLFHLSGDSFEQAFWRGLFTAVSAFCNAGFALQSDSLIPYQTWPIVLHTISSLIILGGIAPATSLLIPKWISGHPVPISARIALKTTIIMLVSGTILILAFEWNGILANLSIVDKIQNSWFQSVTLRTAGFNSVDFSNIANPALIVMIVFMFIGGSPGGTAGGIKTTTIGILAMTFWTNITNRDYVVIRNKSIHSLTIFRAITIVTSGLILWTIIVITLLVTQSISAKSLIFEATSALGTVGLSTGATARLDEIGKIIIIIAMFVGRIGPLTLFMLLSEKREIKEPQYPEEKILLL